MFSSYSKVSTYFQRKDNINFSKKFDYADVNIYRNVIKDFVLCYEICNFRFYIEFFLGDDLNGKMHIQMHLEILKDISSDHDHEIKSIIFINN